MCVRENVCVGEREAENPLLPKGFHKLVTMLLVRERECFVCVCVRERVCV